jgi:hypothetical protein
LKQEVKRMYRDDRNMNRGLAVGATEGKVRFLRPDAVDDVDECHARQRATELHSQHYGTMGVSYDSLYLIDGARPDYATNLVF